MAKEGTANGISLAKSWASPRESAMVQERRVPSLSVRGLMALIPEERVWLHGNVTRAEGASFPC